METDPLTSTPTRSLVLSLVPEYVNEPTIRRDLMVFGEIRGVDLERVRDGYVTVHLNDIRQATQVLNEVQKQYVQHQRRVREHLVSYASPPLPPLPAAGLIGGNAVWAHFTIPISEDNSNQHTGYTRFGIQNYCQPIYGIEGSIKDGREPLSLPKHNRLKNTLITKGGCSSSKHGMGRDEYGRRFIIREEEGIVYASDPRTTLMIRNIPNKHSKEQLLNMLDNHCICFNEQIITSDQPPSSYDFFYLPISPVNNTNMGYAFVNMTSPHGAMRLYNAFQHMKWHVSNSKKICQVEYAATFQVSFTQYFVIIPYKTQILRQILDNFKGLDALKAHFKDLSFRNKTKENMPLVFDPPRDGQRHAQGTPIMDVN
ncbi:uncharacterized protein LOC143557280 [Bidens hawaiensis]|uniref:uncharacterized protein LOC143557280 n=1 Tax=Bidens hawaiensis TaxID=980011 RepID=UPI00404A76D6